MEKMTRKHYVRDGRTIAHKTWALPDNLFQPIIKLSAREQKRLENYVRFLYRDVDFFAAEKKECLSGRALENFNRQKAAEFLVKNFTREKRYLLILSRDMQKYIAAFSADKFKSAEKREQLRYDFFADFSLLKREMSKYRWDKNFLAENGIDFPAVRSLYFSLSKEGNN